MALNLFEKFGKTRDDFITSKELAEILNMMNSPTTQEQANIMVRNLTIYIFP